MSVAPLVSICVPTYNGAEFLDACLDSVLGQDLADIEVLIGDDCSSDDTLAIARRRSDRRLRILPFHERAGMARNWSRTLLEARGKYVALVAQDDLLAPAWGVRLAGLLEDHSEASFAFGHRDFGMTDERSRAIVGRFFEETYPAQLERFYTRIGSVVSPARMVEMAMEHRFELNLTGEPSFNLLRRDHPAVREGYHPEMRQMLDWEFATRFFADAPIVHCPEVLGTYRIHVAGSTVGNSAVTTHYGDYARLIDLVLQRFARLLSAAQVEELRAVRREREQALLAHARDLAAHAQALETERDHLREHSTNLQMERDHLRGHSTTLEAERNQLREHSSTLETELGHLREHSINLQRECSHLRRHLMTVEMERDHLREHSATLETELGHLRKHSATLETERGHLREHSATLETELGHLRKHSATLATERGHLREHSATLETERGHLSEHAATLETEHGHLREHSATLETERNHLREHSATLETERGHLREHVATLETEREHLRGHAENLASERDQLLAHLRNLEQALRRIRSQPVYRVLSKIKDAFSGPRRDG